MFRNITTRNLCASDLGDLHAMASHWPTVRQLGGWPWPADLSFTASRAQPFDGDGFVWGIVRAGRVIGTVGVTNGSLGYMLQRDVWGQGIATVMAGRAIAHAFQTTDHDWIDATVWADNAASRRVLDKLGFQHWHTCFEHAKARRTPMLSHHLRLRRAQWRDLSADAQ
ncbi:GNAT family N-acetyltransferase [Loktanella sp. 3ANDIMAR09]|uniref:GNAT family N-acetyltransferase n=1 Tax=Loktanella sp. 3ANDIMAR09 TaxID=1225657 RepID=UPI000A98E8E8|nr:GNAT family N-acetyltransferase [Loktanella sp. 3ANDIMAR09]